ncbi:MAG: nucleotidyltransferase family protein [Caldilinea sp. CFX5]|nr:nucleotidyltransferase family protein [Caldilinea sp. CFX5]
MKGLILAAGKGTRLRDLTLNRPKPMLPVQGKPLLEAHVAWLHATGIDQIAMNLHHCPNVITDYFGDGSRFGVQLTYSYEPQLLGTAGAAKHLQAFLDEPFVVVYGDVFTNLSLSRLLAFHEARKAQTKVTTVATLALYQVPNPTECGLVAIDATGRIQRFVEKPPPDQVFTDLANAGLMVCEPAILELIPAASEVDFGRHVFPAALAGGYALWGQPIAGDEYVIDIGTFHGYDRAQQVAQTTPAVSGFAQAL